MKLNLQIFFMQLMKKLKLFNAKKNLKKGCNGKLTKCVTHNLWDELENSYQ